MRAVQGKRSHGVGCSRGILGREGGAGVCDGLVCRQLRTSGLDDEQEQRLNAQNSGGRLCGVDSGVPGGGYPEHRPVGWQGEAAGNLRCL